MPAHKAYRKDEEHIVFAPSEKCGDHESFHAPTGTRMRLDALATRKRRAFGANVTRSDIIREALELALPQIEQKLTKLEATLGISGGGGQGDVGTNDKKADR